MKKQSFFEICDACVKYRDRLHIRLCRDHTGIREIIVLSGGLWRDDITNRLLLVPRDRVSENGISAAQLKSDSICKAMEKFAIWLNEWKEKNLKKSC